MATPTNFIPPNVPVRATIHRSRYNPLSNLPNSNLPPYPPQHLQQQQDLFCPRYDGKNEERIQFENESTGESETTKDSEVFIKLRIGNRTGHEGSLSI